MNHCPVFIKKFFNLAKTECGVAIYEEISSKKQLEHAKKLVGKMKVEIYHGKIYAFLNHKFFLLGARIVLGVLAVAFIIAGVTGNSLHSVLIKAINIMSAIHMTIAGKSLNSLAATSSLVNMKPSYPSEVPTARISRTCHINSYDPYAKKNNGVKQVKQKISRKEYWAMVRGAFAISRSSFLFFLGIFYLGFRSGLFSSGRA